MPSAPKNSSEEQSKTAIKCTVKADLTAAKEHEVQGEKNPYVPSKMDEQKVLLQRAIEQQRKTVYYLSESV